MGEIVAEVLRGGRVESRHSGVVAVVRPDGSGRFDTDFMRAMKGRAISKVGAEGVRCAALRAPEPLGITVKIEDGSSRVSAAVLLEVMSQLDLIPGAILQALAKYHHPTLKNCAGLSVGEIRAVVKVK